MSRGVIAVRKWMCAYCEQEQPVGSVKRTSHEGIQIRVGTGWAFADGEFLICEQCYADQISAEPDYRAARGVLPIGPDDERPEDTIRRLRDGGYVTAEPSQERGE